MKKKVVVKYEDGGKLIYRGYREKDDRYFLEKHRYSIGVVSITRQYYPLKDNEAVVIFENK